MKLVEMVMPQMGESIMECTVLTWLKKPGEAVQADDSLLEVATDKVDTEVPAPHTGTLVECLVQEGDVVAIGSTIALLEVADHEPLNETTSLPTDAAEKAAEELENELSQAIQRPGTTAAELPAPTAQEGETNDQNNGFYSPLVLSIAKEEGISREELATITGTGAEGRVTKNDIIQYTQSREQPGPTPAAATPKVPAPASAVAKISAGAQEIVAMDRMRKMIAQRMLDSKRISAHVTSFIETDMTTIVQWRERVKSDFRKQNGDSITFTPLLVEAVVKAIKDYPRINVSVEGDNIILKRDINIGMAVALEDGNLIVPVIHQADQYNLVGLAKKVNDLARRAREHKLTADDLTGGTYTISNIGTFGNLMGTPIIVQPQVAIMAFGAIEKKPAVIETPQGDLLGIRHKMFISHSYDHRVVDGSLGGMFLKRVSDYLQQFDPQRPTA
ncbi:dihydrolipoamide acetyltransferase family protein [Rhabdobacter roseus]|uniref:Dihydrolipoamide acetyltransferase component of pyruvate dehydrogenase complex n=1 Tax=Rhabdobacter roseus TaxID=1655419 RepID=A0A840TGC6_9BACT|nr:dihydrolipoamide acetyltransferase family protein [Rhabdobacter roseus]MBB5283216.1 2-oxoglutarate dehydrogenase E2 component (dihydrolipoamide succinyltransferase) [Rhabdobacter roseus]